MGKWLATVSTRRVEGLDTDGVETLDDWIKRLETVGHYLSCSSGTTGKAGHAVLYRGRHRTVGTDQHRGAAVGNAA